MYGGITGCHTLTEARPGSSRPAATEPLRDDDVGWNRFGTAPTAGPGRPGSGPRVLALA
ncbi:MULTISPECIES: hypothetical protein [unclassified Streptomyces]|uniref:hypothetical protein n=1 Tax=unclassified Streptomyces TaxID=2593676 RepID=UPI003D75141F